MYDKHSFSDVLNASTTNYIWTEFSSQSLYLLLSRGLDAFSLVSLWLCKYHNQRPHEFFSNQIDAPHEHIQWPGSNQNWKRKTSMLIFISTPQPPPPKLLTSSHGHVLWCLVTYNRKWDKICKAMYRWIIIRAAEAIFFLRCKNNTTLDPAWKLSCLYSEIQM